VARAAYPSLMLSRSSSLAGEILTMAQTAQTETEIDPRLFKLEVHLTTGQIIKMQVDPREIAPFVAAGQFPALVGRTDREALRTAAYSIYSVAAADAPDGDGLQVFDTEGRTWAIPHRSIVAINFVDPAMPRQVRRTGFQPAADD